MEIKIIKPLESAMDWMRKVLFQPFNIKKWLLLGVCAWLASFVGGSLSQNNFNVSNLSDMDYSFTSDSQDAALFDAIVSSLDDLQTMLESTDVGFLNSIVIFMLSFIFFFLAITSFFGSRGQFMLLDGVVHNRGEIKKSWHAFKSEANSLYRFYLVYFLSVFSFIGGLIIMVISTLRRMGFNLMDPDAMDFEFADLPFSASALAGVFTGLFLLALMLNIFFWVVNTFVVPIMYTRRCHFLPALSIFRREILHHHSSVVILYGLFHIVLGFAIGVGLIFFMIASLFIGMLLLIIPVVGATILLPITVLLKSYHLAFLGQFGDEFQVLNFTDSVQKDASKEAGTLTGGEGQSDSDAAQQRSNQPQSDDRYNMPDDSDEPSSDDGPEIR